MKKMTVKLYLAHALPNDEGITERKLEFLTPLTGILLPSDTILSSKPHSFTEDLSFRFFCKQKHDELKAGNVIYAFDRFFNIVHVSEYQKIRIVYISTELESEGRRSFLGNLRY